MARYHHGYPPNGPPSQPMSPHHSLLEQELEMQHHEIRRLLGVNRRLVEDRVTLQQELGVAREQCRRMNTAVIEIQNENELHSRQLIESVLKLEADIRATEPFKEEVVQEVKKLNSVTRELYGQVQTLTKELAELQDENKKLSALKNELEELHKEYMLARDAICYEKKVSSEVLDQKQAMENNLVSMAREIERLRAEHSNPDMQILKGTTSMLCSPEEATNVGERPRKLRTAKETMNVGGSGGETVNGTDDSLFAISDMS